MNINVDYKVRQAIGALCEIAENAPEHGMPSRFELQTKLEDFAEAVLESAIDTCVKRAKAAILQPKTTDVEPPATQS